MKSFDGTTIKVGEVYLVKASLGKVSKSGWRKATVTAVDGDKATVTAPGDFGTGTATPKDIKAWLDPKAAPRRADPVEADDPLLDTTPKASTPRHDPIPADATGFDYLKGEFVSYTRKEWKDKVAYAKKHGSVELPYGLGETWLYLPGKTKKLELAFEIYFTGF